MSRGSFLGNWSLEHSIPTTHDMTAFPCEASEVLSGSLLSCSPDFSKLGCSMFMRPKITVLR